MLLSNKFHFMLLWSPEELLYEVKSQLSIFSSFFSIISFSYSSETLQESVDYSMIV
jgi:hypothetical protein